MDGVDYTPLFPLNLVIPTGDYHRIDGRWFAITNPAVVLSKGVDVYFDCEFEMHGERNVSIITLAVHDEFNHTYMISSTNVLEPNQRSEFIDAFDKIASRKRLIGFSSGSDFAKCKQSGLGFVFNHLVSVYDTQGSFCREAGLGGNTSLKEALSTFGVEIDKKSGPQTDDVFDWVGLSYNIRDVIHLDRLSIYTPDLIHCEQSCLNSSANFSIHDGRINNISNLVAQSFKNPKFERIGNSSRRSFQSEALMSLSPTDRVDFINGRFKRSVLFRYRGTTIEWSSEQGELGKVAALTSAFKVAVSRSIFWYAFLLEHSIRIWNTSDTIGMFRQRVNAMFAKFDVLISDQWMNFSEFAFKALTLKLCSIAGSRILNMNGFKVDVSINASDECHATSLRGDVNVAVAISELYNVESQLVSRLEGLSF